MSEKINSPKLSIVIPCKNEEKFIEKTILSLLNQNVDGGIEIIVVDGISTDKTWEILNNLISKYSNLRIFKNEKMITPCAMNIGIRESRGEYIGIFGAHAEYERNYLNSCLSELKKNPNITCIGGPIVSLGKSTFGKATALAMSSIIGVGNARHRFPGYRGESDVVCFPVMKKEIFEKFGYFDERLVKNQDDEFFYRIRKNGGILYLIPEATAYYYVRDSISKLFKQYFYYGYFRFAVIKLYKMPASWRQMVPFGFYFFLISLFLFEILSHNIPRFTLILLAFYITSITIFGFFFNRKEKLKVLLYFPLSVLILHSSYALGSFKGFIDFIIFKKDKF